MELRWRAAAVLLLLSAIALGVEASSLKFVYHVKPADLKGTTLYSLNRLKELHPDVYESIRHRYDDRPEVLNAPAPGTDLLWNDFVFFSPLHPVKIYRALREVGIEPRDLEFFEIPAEQLWDSPVYLYSFPENWQEGLHLEDFERVDLRRQAALTEVPEATLAYFRECYETKERPLLFYRIPHVLVAEPVELCGAKLIRWHEELADEPQNPVSESPHTEDRPQSN